jgi:hypothetical protein
VNYVFIYGYLGIFCSFHFVFVLDAFVFVKLLFVSVGRTIVFAFLEFSMRAVAKDG